MAIVETYHSKEMCLKDSLVTLWLLICYEKNQCDADCDLSLHLRRPMMLMHRDHRQNKVREKQPE